MIESLVSSSDDVNAAFFRSMGGKMYLSNEIDGEMTFREACELTLDEIETQLQTCRNQADLETLTSLKDVLSSTIAGGGSVLDQPVVTENGQNPGFTPLYYALEDRGISFVSSGTSPTTILFSFNSIDPPENESANIDGAAGENTTGDDPAKIHPRPADLSKAPPLDEQELVSVLPESITEIRLAFDEESYIPGIGEYSPGSLGSPNELFKSKNEALSRAFAERKLWPKILWMEGPLAFIDHLGVEKAVLRHMETADASHYLNNSAYIQTEYKTSPKTYLITFFATPEGTERFARAIDGPIPVDETPPPEKSGCFIATAAYGTGMEVQVLSEFRDHVLRRSYPGRIICNVYYSVSPRIAGAIRNNSSLKTATRLFLSPVILAIRAFSRLLNLQP